MGYSLWGRKDSDTTKMHATPRVCERLPPPTTMWPGWYVLAACACIPPGTGSSLTLTPQAGPARACSLGPGFVLQDLPCAETSH